MFISTLDLNSCSALLIITQCATVSRYFTGTPQKWKLLSELTMAADNSLCETSTPLSRVAIFDASAQCRWMPYICQINLLTRPQCMSAIFEIRS
jgi:hypothetical protein